MKKIKFRRPGGDRGQVLILALVMLLGIIIMVLVLFDLHSSMRAKIKVETAQQAAALAGAQWQVKTLNLIGQINLIKASSMMIDDDASPIAAPAFDNLTGSYTEEEIQRFKRAARVRALTEMQSRISFVMPVLGCFAVQQTAKQNGMPSNNTVLQYYSDHILPDHDSRDMQFNGYYWFAPYQSLVASLADQGCAVRVNSRVFEIPEVWSGSVGSMRFLLSENDLYEAIRTGNYCYWQLMNWAKAGIVASGDWWKVDYLGAPFVEESELLTIGVRHRAATLDAADRALLAEQAALWKLPDDVMESDKLMEVNWCGYDSLWDPGAYSPDNYSEHMSNFQRGAWLREDLRPGVMYDGPYTAVDNFVTVTRFNRTSPRPPVNANRLADGADTGEADRTLAVERSSFRVNTVGRQATRDGENYGVAAKPIGYFNEGRSADDSPISVPMILPVFKQAALVPSSLPYNLTMLTSGLDDLRRFLLWLRDVSDIHNPDTDPPSGTEWRLQVLLKLEDETYMKSIYNTEFSGVDALPATTIFGESYYYPADPNGAGWLQQAWIGEVSATPYYKRNPDGTYEQVPDDIPTQETADMQTEADGALRTYYGNPRTGYQYFLTKSGKILTNEDLACGRARTGPGSGMPPGSNSGPQRL